jgi:hypothetical protein
VASYEHQRSTDGRAWATIPTASRLTRSVVLSLARNRTYQFQVRAVDGAGNVGAWSGAGAFRVTVAQESSASLAFVKGPWVKRVSSSFDLGAARSSVATGAIARFTVTGTSFAWVGAKGPSRGAAGIYVDDVFAGTVDTHQAAVAARVLVWSRTWSSSDRHTIEIRSEATGGHPRIDLDAFAFLKPVAGLAPPPSPAPTPTPAPAPAPNPAPTPTPTPLPAGSSAVFVGAGDIASCGLTADTATAKLVSSIAGTVFAAGDEAYESGSAAEFQNCYDPTWGPFRGRTRAEMAALLASLWVDIDVALPYAAGELLARVRERGAVELEYGERDVRVTGRVAPGLAGELGAVAERWAASLHEDDLVGAGSVAETSAAAEAGAATEAGAAAKK